MWYENSTRGREVYKPAGHDEAIEWVERTLPALMCHTTFAVKEFFDAVASVNARITAFTHVCNVPKAALANFSGKVGAIDAVIREEKVVRGGVFLPYEGEPWEGFRMGNSPIQQDLGREIVSDMNFLESLVQHSLVLVSNSQPVVDRGGVAQAWATPRRYLEKLVNLYSCPAAETWQPTGWKYKEVQHALGAAINPGVIYANKLIPEARIIPYVSEVLADYDLKTVSRRVMEQRELATSQQGLEFDAVVGQKPIQPREATPSRSVPEAPKPTHKQMSMDI